jgi:hypothetical protein
MMFRSSSASLLLVLTLFLPPLLISQHTLTPIAFPEFGDTLDVQERDRFSLFPSIDEFRYATFFMRSQDSILFGKVFYEKGGILKFAMIPVGTMEQVRRRWAEIDTPWVERSSANPFFSEDARRQLRSQPYSIGDWKNSSFISVVAGGDKRFRLDFGVHLLGFVGVGLSLGNMSGYIVEATLPKNHSLCTVWLQYHGGFSHVLPVWSLYAGRTNGSETNGSWMFHGNSSVDSLQD